MLPIRVDEIAKEKCPQLKLGCLQCDVSIRDDYPELLEMIDKEIQNIRSKIQIENISKISTISSARRAYKAAGKDPARYRLSAESLLRRVVKGNNLYKINNVVDLLNLVSIQSGISIGGYDVSKIEGTATFGIGKENEPYEGIGRGVLNIENMPVFRDNMGAFGSPTSDSSRTMVTQQTKSFLMVFFGFGGLDLLNESLDLATNYLTQFVHATNFERKVI